MSLSSISTTVDRYARLNTTASYSLPTAGVGRLAACDCGSCGQCSPSALKATTEAAVFEKSPEAEALAARPENQTEAKSGAAADQKNDKGLTAEEEEEVKELKKRDAEVRQHEYAHLAAAGPHALGGPTYEFTTGPDGQRYAIGGEVQIDTSPVPNDPAATIEKAKTVKRAALAPAEPSAQDRRVAAQASQMEAKARQELAAQAAETQATYTPQAQQTSQKIASSPAIFNVMA